MDPTYLDAAKTAYFASEQFANKLDDRLEKAEQILHFLLAGKKRAEEQKLSPSAKKKRLN